MGLKNIGFAALVAAISGQGERTYAGIDWFKPNKQPTGATTKRAKVKAARKQRKKK